MEAINNINFWITGLATYFGSMILLVIFLKLKASNSLNFRTIVLLVIWVVNIVFISRSVELIGRQLDLKYDRHMYFQSIGLLTGLVISGLISWGLSVFIVKKFYNTSLPYAGDGKISFPHISDRQFGMYVYRYYFLFVVCLVLSIFCLPLLLVFLVKEGYLSFVLDSHAAASIIPYTLLLMVLMIPVSLTLLNRLFRRRMTLVVNAYGISLLSIGSDIPVTFLLWSDVEGFRFKLSSRNGAGVLAAYAGGSTLLQLNCWGMPVKNTFIQPNELRGFTDFLIATFGRQQVRRRFVFSLAIIGDDIVEIRNEFYTKK